MVLAGGGEGVATRPTVRVSYGYGYTHWAAGRVGSDNNFRPGSGTGTVSIIGTSGTGTGRVAEMLDPHTSIR